MQRREAGFTLLELITAMLIIGIVGLLLVYTIPDVRARAETGNCIANMRNLYVAANTYWIEQKHWPQVDPKLNAGAPPNMRKSGSSRSSPTKSREKAGSVLRCNGRRRVRISTCPKMFAST